MLGKKVSVRWRGGGDEPGRGRRPGVSGSLTSSGIVGFSVGTIRCCQRVKVNAFILAQGEPGRDSSRRAT